MWPCRMPSWRRLALLACCWAPSAATEFQFCMRLLSAVALAVSAVLAFAAGRSACRACVQRPLSGFAVHQLRQGRHLRHGCGRAFHVWRISEGHAKPSATSIRCSSCFRAMGAGVMLSAHNLITLYMGIETLSLASYVLAAFKRDSVTLCRSWSEVFCTRRAGVRPAALWIVPDLRLCTAARDTMSLPRRQFPSA